MGRLFWKFFFSFWLTLLIAAVSTGSVVWLKHAAKDDGIASEVHFLDYRGIAYIKVAADIAEQQGPESLQAFLSQLTDNDMTSVLAVDQHGQELLARPVDRDTLLQARQLHQKGKDRIVKMVQLEDRQWLLFAPLAQPKKAPIFKKGWIFKHMPLLLMVSSALLASLLFSALLAWYFTRPITSLKKAFRDVADGQLDTRVSPTMANRRDELAELGSNFDYMTSQISALVNGQRQLLHDVSHELRSPLARMQAAIGLAQQQPDKVAMTFQRLEKETDRMSELVGELLLLSRMETGVNHNQPATIDINLLLDEIVADARFEAEAKSVSIDYRHNGDVTLRGQQELLHRAVENVLRNAVKFSQAGDSIKVTANVNQARESFVIEISDQGPGVAQSDLDKLFRPFFRGQQSRQDGIGLGLTIAQRAVSAHRGQIEAANQSQGGLMIRITLPLK